MSGGTRAGPPFESFDHIHFQKAFEPLPASLVPLEWFLMRVRLAVVAVVAILLLALLAWHLGAKESASLPAASGTPVATPAASRSPESAPTAVYAHNLMLRKGPDFRIYVRWLRGNMVRTRRDVNPTFDDPESFFSKSKPA